MAAPQLPSWAQPCYPAPITMILSIFNGTQLILEGVDCRSVRLPNGRTGAVWGGLAFPLGPGGDTLDVSVDGVAPGRCAPLDLVPTPPLEDALLRRFALIEGDGAAYVLVAGSVADRERAASLLDGAGFQVLRSGRYLGEPVEGFAAEWFIRLVKPEGPKPLAEIVGRVLDAAPVDAAPGHADLRRRLLAAELTDARARRARDLAEIERLRLVLAERTQDAGAAAELRARVDEERHRREEAEAELLRLLASAEAPMAVAEPLPPDPASRRPTGAASTLPPPTTRPSARLAHEVEDVVTELLPRIRFLRDSLTTVTTEFAERRSVYRALRELQETSDGRPKGWKKLQGVEGWWERHVSNGQDDAGRAYARLDPRDRSWQVLVSHKREQKRDIEWLDSSGQVGR